jgi:VWFA-related protein
LYDVIAQGADLLDSRTGRKALVVFTDGQDSRSFTTLEEIERRLQRSDLTLYMIGQGQGITNDPLRGVMDRLSRPTGGRAFFTERIDELHDVFAALLDELSQQYGLGYESTNRARDGTWRRITVHVDGQPRVRARQGYRAPSSSRQRR